MRISGINIPDEKKLEIALGYIYGIGRKNVVEVLEKANIDGAKRVHSLTEEEQKRIQQASRLSKHIKPKEI
jgi:small subunit ribosomal protein S13